MKNALHVTYYTCRRNADNKYVPTTWGIKFNLKSVTGGIYKLRLAIASANRTDLQVLLPVLGSVLDIDVMTKLAFNQREKSRKDRNDVNTKILCRNNSK